MIGSQGSERDVEVAIEEIDAHWAVRVMFLNMIVIAKWRNHHGNSV